MTSLDDLIRKNARAHKSAFEGAGSAADALARLRAARLLQGELETLELKTALEARAEGASWEALRKAADLQRRSSAQRRYAAESVEDRKLKINEATVRAREKKGTLASSTTVYRGRNVTRIDPAALPE